MLDPGSRFRMADVLLETHLRQLLEAYAGVPVVCGSGRKVEHCDGRLS